MGVNALEFFLTPCRCRKCSRRQWELRNWDQFKRFYFTVSQITGSYTQSMQVNDPDVIEVFCSVKTGDKHWVSKPPPWWRFTDTVHKLTDIADQLIASRARGDDVKFYPRPVNPAAKERKRRGEEVQDDVIERSRRANKERRAKANGLI